ncbi:MAG: outer membrane protein [Bradyrhizobium sp.]|uniref:outer membrane protein n=1 Tax=Bradyrhizobium sp. TaxID=376 RepID=UPI003532F498
MKKLLLGIAGVIALTAPAAAADLAARPYAKAPAMIAAVYDWSGFYIGANGGWGSSHKCWDIDVAGVFVNEGCHNATGGTAGGQIGYRWQAGTWVFGLEGQGNWADLKGSNVSLVAPAFTNQSTIGAFGLLTGQIGYAANNVLLYVKGGAAVTDDRFRSFVTGTNVLAANPVNDTRWGGTVGVGLEFGFSPNWSAAVAYDHLFMGTRTYNFVTPAGAFFAQDRIKQDVDLVTVRVNYRWGGPVVAKY